MGDFFWQTIFFEKTIVSKVQNQTDTISYTIDDHMDSEASYKPINDIPLDQKLEPV